MKYNVGDKVRIKSIDWYNENKDEYGNIDINCDFTFYADRSKYCGKVFTISEVFDNCYGVKEDNNEYYWTDEMIEGLVEKKISIKLTGEAIKNNEMVVSVDEYILPEGYIIKDENDNVINATKIVLEKKKKEYPKTYKECCDVLGLNTMDNDAQGYKWELIIRLQELLIARDAYWKIAGEEMGLDESWEPDWEDDNEKKYTIYTMGNKVIRHVGGYIHAILAFPTEKMRDTFNENFKELIKSCKELL